MQDESPEGNPEPSLPAAIVNVSAQTMSGLEELQAALQPLLPSLNISRLADAYEDSKPDKGWS